MKCYFIRQKILFFSDLYSIDREIVLREKDPTGYFLILNAFMEKRFGRLSYIDIL